MPPLTLDAARKAAAPMRTATGKPQPKPSTVALASGALATEGIVTAIVAVTGVTDQVDDVIIPGAFGRTLAVRRPKVVFHHDWLRFLGRVLHIAEWMPGDPRLPKQTKDGKPWPAGAGALVATMQFNMATEAGRTGWEWVRFYSESNECEFSIGYKVVPGRTAKRRDGARLIYDLDVFELSLVLFGAASQTMTLEVKGIDIRGLEHKNVAVPAVVDAGTAMQALLEAKDAGETAEPKVAGLAVLAADTGRILMLQRALTHNDPAAGTWEFPGGHLDDGEDPATGAAREWCEETGMTLPDGELADTYDSPNGVYRLHAYVTPIESQVTLNPAADDRHVTNPDDPNSVMPEVTAWWDLRHAQSNPALRTEVQDNTDWTALAGLVGGNVESDLTDGVEGKTAAEVVAHMRLLSDGLEAKHDYSPIGTPGGRQNWVDGVDGLPLYIRDVAHALKRNGHDESEAIQMAVGSIKRWAHGGDNVTPETQAKATAALAEWERKKAQSHATPHAQMEGKSMADMAGSFEERRDAINCAVRDLFRKDDSDDNDTSGQLWTCIEATYPTYVVVTVNDPDGDDQSYQVDYSIDDSGAVTLSPPQPVTLSVVATPDTDDAAGDGDEADAETAATIRFITPAANLLGDAASYVALAPEGKSLEDLRAPLQRLLDTLAAKGMAVDDMYDDKAAPDQPTPTDTPAGDSDGADAEPDSDVDDPWAGLLTPYDNTDKAAPAADATPDVPAPDGAAPAPAPDVPVDPEDAVDGGADEATEGDAPTAPAGDGDPEDATDGGADEDTEDADGNKLEGKVLLDIGDVLAELAALTS